MPRPALTEEQKRATSNKIRAAAAKIYRDNGVKNITVRGVAAEADVSVGTVYAYFGSLSELLQSLWREPVKDLIKQMEALATDIECPKARLEALLAAYQDFSQAKEPVFRNSFLFVRPENV